MCDILHLEGRKISKNKYGGRQPKKFENPCLKCKYKKSYFIHKYGKTETSSLRFYQHHCIEKKIEEEDREKNPTNWLCKKGEKISRQIKYLSTKAKID